MGYHITLESSNFTIPAENVAEAFERLKALNHKPGVEKRGGWRGPNGQTVKWFSWMSDKYDEVARDAAHIFEMLGFEVDTAEDGAITLEYYDGKMGQEDLFITEVGDLAVPGWALYWRGEDGDHWRHTAEGIKQGTVTY